MTINEMMEQSANEITLNGTISNCEKEYKMNKEESSLDTILRVMKKYANSSGNIDIRSDKFKIGVVEWLDILDDKTWELKREIEILKEKNMMLDDKNWKLERKIEILKEKNMLLKEIIGKSNFAPLLKGDSDE